MARLLQHSRAAAMLSDHALCSRVVTWKSRVFARQWARYDLARPGSFRFQAGWRSSLAKLVALVEAD